MKPNIIALIPAYNEEDTIVDVIQRTKRFVDQIIVINDGSTDSTKQVAEQAGAVVIDNIVNRGLGETMKHGYKEALSQDADLVVQLDADGQYLAEEIPVLIRPIIENEADLVLGSRYEKIQYKMPFINKFGNKAFSSVLRMLTGADVADGQTGFRAMRREVLETAMPSNKYTYTQEMIIKTSKEGWRIKSWLSLRQIAGPGLQRSRLKKQKCSTRLSGQWKNWLLPRLWKISLNQILQKWKTPYKALLSLWKKATLSRPHDLTHNFMMFILNAPITIF